jgi:hypothetical protein
VEEMEILLNGTYHTNKVRDNTDYSSIMVLAELMSHDQSYQLSSFVVQQFITLLFYNFIRVCIHCGY